MGIRKYQFETKIQFLYVVNFAFLFYSILFYSILFYSILFNTERQKVIK